MITVKNVSKNFGKIMALDSISFHIRKGEVVGLLGPNGAGKTTTMRILTSFLSPDSGEVTINGKNVFSNPYEAKRLIGYLPEETPLYSNMKVHEFLIYCAKLKGFYGKNMKIAVDKSIEQCQLKEVSKRVIAKLSKGYRQRVGLAQSLISDPPILILDEPTVGLDPSQVVQVRNLIKNLREDRTIIISTHILSEVEAACEKVIIIHHGRIVKESELKELTAPTEGATKITVEIKGDIDSFISVCKKIDEIMSIGKTDAGEIVVETNTRQEAKVRMSLFQAAVSSGLVLMEMKKDRITLEKIFLEITQDS